MKGFVLVASGLLLLLCLCAGPAEAANIACFDWSCNENNTGVCTFNAGCTQLTQGSLWRYSWAWGDGNNNLTGSAVIGHTYSSPVPCNATVQLTVIPFSADNFSTSCEIIVRTCVGPPIAMSGRCQG